MGCGNESQSVQLDSRAAFGADAKSIGVGCQQMERGVHLSQCSFVVSGHGDVVVRRGADGGRLTIVSGSRAHPLGNHRRRRSHTPQLPKQQGPICSQQQLELESLAFRHWESPASKFSDED
jgi:hypothetical protein